jgi:eukaryotic-like serine/threonine-protein kinase
MSAADFWSEAYRVFSAAIELPPGDRAHLVARETAHRDDLQREVLALLAAHEVASDFLPAPADRDRPQGGSTSRPGEPVGTDDTDEAFPEGTLAGPWRLLTLLGEGGMGRVYRAERADGAYAQQVAVKVTRVSLIDREAARRFRAERAILAGLTHPNIVRLLDGGTLPSGQAWLAMELVEGTPITRAVIDKAMPVVGRLRLFREVCAAVHYAHQHGVVHRDLKPQNVLVGADGAAKVVDFGVAKLLDARPGDADANATSMTRAPLTPNYASPEQLRGLPVTTASDVYALGVLLYELLTGAKPYETTGKPLDEVLAIVLERQPPRPGMVSLPNGSRAGRAWPRRADLDAVVMRAMAKEPERRYASASELADDVGRYLDARPVQAQEPSFAYVASRLVRRHAVAFGVAAVALVAVVASLGVSLWQTRVAERERARAETRLVEVRQLANSLVFKVHDAVASLDGSTPVRQTIVGEAIAYLERLAAEPGDDPTLRLELVEAYTRVAGAQGDPQRPNLGDRAGAISSFSRALALAEPLLQTPDLRVRASALRAAGRAGTGLASVYGAQGRRDDARAMALRVVAHAEALRELQPTDDVFRGNLASAYFTLALAQNGTPEALEAWRKSGAINEALLAERPDDPNRMRNVALVAKYLAAEYELANLNDDAERETARALELDERRLALAPTDRTVQFDVSNDLVGLAASRTVTARYDEARALLDRAVALRRQMAAADPKDILAPSKIGSVEWRQAENAILAGRRAEARNWADRAVATLSGVRTRTDDAIVLRDLAAAHIVLALAHGEAPDAGPRCDAVRRAMAIAEELRARKVARIWPIVDERLPGLAAACGRR